MSPKRVQMRRDRPWRPDHPDAVIVARPSKWGNPFTMAAAIDTGYSDTKEQARELCVNAFRSFMTGGCEFDWHGADDLRSKMRGELEELRGRDLACWCPLDQPCHADVLLELANRPINPVE